MKLRGTVIVVTGGGSGIGRQLVLQLLERGARVAAVDLRPEGLEETARLAGAGSRLATRVLDVTDRDAVEALPEWVIDTFGQVDGYISNAGIIQPFVRLVDLDYRDIERVIDVNLYGTITMAKAFVPVLLSRPAAHVVNVSSMGGFLPVPGQTVYGAAKAGVKLLTEGLYAELLETSVDVSVVMPGAVATNIAANSGIDMGSGDGDGSSPSLAAEEAARIILDGMEKAKLHILVGRDSRSMNRLVRVAPRRATHLIYKQMKDLLPEAAAAEDLSTPLSV